MNAEKNVHFQKSSVVVIVAACLWLVRLQLEKGLEMNGSDIIKCKEQLHPLLWASNERGMKREMQKIVFTTSGVFECT